MKTGIAGNLAKQFINSKLTPLLMIAFMAIGIYSAYLTPREEEPQIDVPIADIFVNYPGASPKEVESRVIAPLEKLLTNIQGVEYVYSTAMPGHAMLIVRFYVGENVENSLVKFYNEVMKHMDKMPAGVSMPLIKTRSIDDVPALGLTLWSDTYDSYQIRRVAQELASEIKKVSEVAETSVIGGSSRQISVMLDREKMNAFGIDLLSISNQIRTANQQVSSGNFNMSDQQFLVETGKFLENTEDIKNLVVGVKGNTPIYLKQIAEINDGADEPQNYVSFGYGKSSDSELNGDFPAVTIAISKRKGADAMSVAEQVLSKTETLKKTLIPNEIKVEVTRNYGETASEKVSELILHLLGAIIAVTIVVALSMGWRGGLVVFLSVPITFALTLFVYYLLGYTLNRITLFALVFVTGIVVDDSIIIAENMHRHFKMGKLPFMKAALASINEVGNPTILATFTVIASVLPMVFVSGLMGPYMSPMPIGASLAMIFSLIVALIITPYLAYRLLKYEEEKKETFILEKTLIYRIYNTVTRPLIENKTKAFAFIGSTTILLIASMTLFYFKMVAVKMLPFDNKNEFQVIIDMPEGTTLERTALVTREIASYLSEQDYIQNYQTYVGTAAPINFNGLVRHYDLRKGAHMADIQVNITQKQNRNLQSHDIAKNLRPGIQKIAKPFNANVKVVEVPPGPPVMSTLVAEIYGPDLNKQKDIANQVKRLFADTEGIVDIDWWVEDDQVEYKFEVDKEKAMLAGISTQQVVNTLNTALEGNAISYLYQEEEKEAVAIKLRLKESERSGIDQLKKVNILSNNGNLVAIGDIVSITNSIQEKSIMRKNQKRVVYITADVAGAVESPVYAILDVADKLNEIKLPAGYSFTESYTEQPFLEDDYSLKWDGEWHITYEVFRDLGAAFAVVLVVIYILIIGWFQDFKVPFVMMVAIPLSLVGILIGHWLLGAFFTATSMIGMIALAGIMVRNSVLLIDFINIRLEEGVDLKEACIEAGAVRTTPILLTAGTVVIGAFVILFDPIFQGLAISLMGGSIASTALTLLIVPLVYYMTEKKKYETRNNTTSKINGVKKEEDKELLNV